MHGFTCRKNEKECSSKVQCYVLNKQTHSYPTLYAVLKPCEDGLKQDGAWIEEIYEPIIGQYSSCSKTVVNRISKELLVVNEVDLSGMEHEQVLNLNDDGERWQGDVLDDCPFGWGVLYDSENRKAYEGFRIRDVNVCYGRSYYPDIQKVEYEGVICEGRRCGRGVQYDRNGDVMIDGEWIADAKLKTSITISEESTFLHSMIEELIVSDNCCNGEEWKVLEFGLMPFLRDLHIGDYCFKEVDRMELIGLNYLERVVIGKHCFSTIEEIVVIKSTVEDYSHRHFFLKNCNSVKELIIGNDSFLEYDICVIENDPSLERILFGESVIDHTMFFHSSLFLRSKVFYAVIIM